MKYQAAHTIGTTYKFWVEIGAPQPMALREIDTDRLRYAPRQEGRFYRTNMVNPVYDPGHRIVFVRQDQTELENEFADDVAEDTNWWK